MRLLTEEEILNVLDTAPKPCPMEFRDEPKIRAIAKAQDAKTHKETLKEMGKWLKKSISLDELWTWEPDIETLLRGEMPEEGI